jgi:Transglutaminase-like superfamily
VTLSEARLAAATGIWVLALPLRLRFQALPRLIERLGGNAGSRTVGGPDPNRVAAIVTRVCRMRVFDLPVFPRLCLRRALAVYRVLVGREVSVEIHIGVRKQGYDLHAHSWIMLAGRALGEPAPTEDFRTIYSFPANSRMHQPLEPQAAQVTQVT